MWPEGCGLHWEHTRCLDDAGAWQFVVAYATHVGGWVHSLKADPDLLIIGQHSLSAASQ